MAYFLKKSMFKKGLYLQIYESFYDPERNQTAHHCYRTLGYLDKLKTSDIEDPIDYYQREVDKLNLALKEKKLTNKVRLISDISPERYLGYFLLKNLNDGLKVKNDINLFKLTYDFQFDIYKLLSSLVYSRVVQPCSKLKTYNDVFPKLFEESDFSLDQIYSGLNFMGIEYEKLIEIYNYHLNKKYPFNTTHTYFDCTNFFFEIDKEDDFRKNGPGKENRNSPIVGLGLLLDANQIPIGMKMFPGNESEKPIIREVIDGLKSRNNITGRTIQVADKGLNCAKNIFHAKKSGDGYIFSKSVKMLPETEKVWIFLDNDYIDVKDEKGVVKYRYKECVDQFPYTFVEDNGKKTTVKLTEKRVVTFNHQLAKKKIREINKMVQKAALLNSYRAKKSEYGDCGKYVTFNSTDDKGKITDDKVRVTLNQSAIDEDLKLAGYNLLITSESKMSALEIYQAYHNLWRIEESFRIMKSQLDARPVFLQNEDTIIGHFFICYIAVLLIRLLQFKVLNNKYSSEDIISFIKEFKVVKTSDYKYLNMTKKSDFITAMSSMTRLPINSYYLSDSQIKTMLDFKL